jgi:hypothetical protein
MGPPLHDCNLLRGSAQILALRAPRLRPDEPGPSDGRPQISDTAFVLIEGHPVSLWQQAVNDEAVLCSDEDLAVSCD